MKKSYKQILSLIAAVSFIQGCTTIEKEKKEVIQPKVVSYKIQEPDISRRINFNRANWFWDEATPKTIKSIELALANETEDTICNIKYKLFIVAKHLINNDLKEKIIFSKDFIYQDTLYPGNVVRIPVIELNDFYLGVLVKNCTNNEGITFIDQDYWSYSTKISEVEQINYRNSE